MTNMEPSGTFSPFEDPSISSSHFEPESSNVSFLTLWKGYRTCQQYIVRGQL